MDYESYKREHLLALHREIEESLNSDTYSIHSNESRKSKKDAVKSSKDGKLLDIPEKDGELGDGKKQNYSKMCPEERFNRKDMERDKFIPDNRLTRGPNVKEKTSGKNSRKGHHDNHQNLEESSEFEAGKINLADLNDLKYSEDHLNREVSATKSKKKDGRLRKGTTAKQHHLSDDNSDLDVSSSSEFEVESRQKRQSKCSKQRSKDNQARDTDPRDTSVLKSCKKYSCGSKREDFHKKKDAEREKSETKSMETSRDSEVRRLVPNKSVGQPQASVGSAIGQVCRRHHSVINVHFYVVVKNPEVFHRFYLICTCGSV